MSAQATSLQESSASAEAKSVGCIARVALAQQRVQNVVALAGQAAIGIASLDALITSVSADKPFLELELRQLQRLVSVGVAGVIMNYASGL